MEFCQSGKVGTVKYYLAINSMLFTAVALKALSNGTIAVCLEMKLNEEGARSSTEETESKERVEENFKEQKEDERETFVLLQYDSKGHILFRKTLNYKPCFMIEMMLEKKMCLVISIM